MPSCAMWSPNCTASGVRNPFSSIRALLPPEILCSSNIPSMPHPGFAVNPSTFFAVVCRSSASRQIALARGCSLFFSSEYAVCKSSSWVSAPNTAMSVTRGFPSVTVPVLSSTAYCVLPVCSNAVAFLKRIPFLAPMPLPTMIATGVASPREQGQLITSTLIACDSAFPTPAPAISHTAPVTNAMPITTGTKTPETLSAICATGAFVATAFSTMSMICCRVVSFPTLDALQVSIPFWFRVAALTRLPVCLSTGRLSPVSADSSTALAPFVTSPSTGMLSPGRTTKISPTVISSAGMVTSSPFRITWAVLGARFISPLTALVVLPLL